MATLIDGYNLLYAVGILGRNLGPGSLERARNALLGFLAGTLSESERAETTVVFDAKARPPGLPRERNYRGIRVLYAVGHPDADDLLEQLIRADSSPRRLVVVSSDHQLHRAARRRRATAVDSDRWYDDLCRQRRARERARPVAEDKPPAAPDESESAYWIQAFSAAAATDGDAEVGADRATRREPPDRSGDDAFDGYNPFPPGYADDVLAEEERNDG